MREFSLADQKVSILLPSNFLSNVESNLQFDFLWKAERVHEYLDPHL